MKTRNQIIFILIIIAFSSLLFATDIYNLLDPIYGGRYGKKPSDGPPFYKFGNTTQYYHIASAAYQNYTYDVTACFDEWNNAGSVEISSHISYGLSLLTFWSSDGYPGIVNPGSALTDDNNYIIDLSGSNIKLNTFHNWHNI